VTGPEHYRRAEELAERADEFVSSRVGVPWAAAAQVHATLALAAATALGAASPVDTQAWRDAAGTKPAQ
jgi:hypothetical protein